MNDLTGTEATPDGIASPFAPTFDDMVSSPYPDDDYIDFAEERSREALRFQMNTYDGAKAEAHKLISMQVILASAAIGFATPQLGSGTFGALELVFFTGIVFGLLAAATAVLILHQRDLPQLGNDPRNLLPLHRYGEVYKGRTTVDTSVRGVRMNELRNLQEAIDDVRAKVSRMGTVLNWMRGLTAGVPGIAGLAAIVMMRLGLL